MKKNINSNTQKTLEVSRKIRGDWGSVNPVTRIIPDKRRKDPKHKGRQFDY